jgi:hypothetical protein
MRRTFWVPPRYHRLIARIFDGDRTTQRALAESLGYSLSGLHHAIDSLKEMGIVARVITVRGRLGYTIIKVAKDITARVSGNVPPTGRRDIHRGISTSLWGEHLATEVPKGGGYEAWKRLGEAFRRLSR